MFCQGSRKIELKKAGTAGKLGPGHGRGGGGAGIELLPAPASEGHLPRTLKGTQIQGRGFVVASVKQKEDWR